MAQWPQASVVTAWPPPGAGALFPEVPTTRACLWLALTWGSPERLEQTAQPADRPDATARKPCPHAVGERWLPKKNEVSLPEKGARAPCRQKRWMISYRPGSRLTRHPWPANGYCTSWTGWAAGFQSGCDRDPPLPRGLSHLLSPPPDRSSAVTTTWTRRRRRTSVCGAGVTAQPATPSWASLRPMTSAEVRSLWGLQMVQTGVCRMPLPGILLAGTAPRWCDLVLRS